MGFILEKIRDKILQADVAKIDTSRLHNDVTEVFDAPYIDDNFSGHTYDVFYRKDGNKKPILIDIHGGGFITEDKSMNRMFGNYMAHFGFTVFELNVRLAYLECSVFDQIMDIDCAVRYVLEHADDYEGDTSNLYVAGHSSGAVLAVSEVLLCLDSNMRADYGIKDRDYKYKGVITDCGLLHFYKGTIPYWGMRGMIFPKGYKKDKRYKYLVFNQNESISLLPKMAILTNKKDVLRKMTFQFDNVLTERNVEHELMLYGPVAHTGIIFYPYTEENVKVIEKVKKYLTAEENGYNNA